MAVVFPPYSGGGGGGGGVSSVNGDVGPAVVLDASDVGAATTASVAALDTRLDALEAAGFVTSSDGSVEDIRALTPAQYDAIVTPDADTVYVTREV